MDIVCPFLFEKTGGDRTDNANTEKNGRRIVINDGLTITEPADGLPFGTDALLLAAFVRPMGKAAAAELGCGTGAVSLLCAKRGKFASVCAMEIQPSLAALAAQNARENALEGVVDVRCIDVRDCRGEEYDVVFTNPPYMVAGGIASPDASRQIARHEVCGTLADFVEAGGRMLRCGGLFYCVCRPDRTVDLLCAMRQNRLEPKRMVFVCADREHAPALLLTEAKKGAKPGVDVQSTLYLREDGKPSVQYTYLLENGVFGTWK